MVRIFLPTMSLGKITVTMNFPLQSVQRVSILVVVIISCGIVTISVLCKAAIHSVLI